MSADLSCECGCHRRPEPWPCDCCEAGRTRGDGLPRCGTCKAWEGHHSKDCPKRPDGEPCPIDGCPR